jgi:N-acetylglucosamine-6-phosphate deacetylase
VPELSWLRADRLFTPEVEHSPGVLSFDGAGRIVDLGGEVPPGARTFDLGERIVVPGFVDVHVHGGAGAQVNGDDEDEVLEALECLCRFHASHGTTTLLATTVSDSTERLATSLRAIARATKQKPSGARVAGAHLEGPFIARARMGAQDPGKLRPPELDELFHLAEEAGGFLRLVTVAPELPGALQAIAHGKDLGVLFALGHSDADYDSALAAFDAGACHVAHLFNAMAPLHHRRPGLLGAALSRRDVSFELICDLEHVHPAVLSIAARLGEARAVAVSDATALAGATTAGGRPLLGSLEVRVRGRRVELADDPNTLAGSLLTMDQAVANLNGVVGLDLPRALSMASSTPGRLLEKAGAGSYGRLAVGDLADLVVLEPDLSVAATLVAGEVAYDGAGLFQKVSGGT